MSAAAVVDLKTLRDKAEYVEWLVIGPRLGEDRQDRVAGRLSRADGRMDWYRRVEDGVLDLSNAMPEGIQDYDVRKLLELVVELRRLLEAEVGDSDSSGEIELTTLRTADVVGRLRQRLLREHLDDPGAASRFVFMALVGVPTAEIANLLGVSTKTVSAWRQGRPVRQKAGRVILVAQLISYLRSSMTPRGLIMWFQAHRDQLGGRTPLQLLDEDAASAQDALTRLAHGGRAQLAN